LTISLSDSSVCKYFS